MATTAYAIARKFFLLTRTPSKATVRRAVQAVAFESDRMTRRRRVEAVFAEVQRILRVKRERFRRLPAPDGPCLSERLDAFKRKHFAEASPAGIFRTTQTGRHITELNWVE